MVFNSLVTGTRFKSRLDALKEVVAVARQGWLIPQAGRSIQHHAESDHLVVFVHGYFASAGVFNPMARHLAHTRMAPRQVHFTYLPQGSIAHHAERLARVVERARPTGPVSLVAHSLGGLISRYYAQVLGGRMDALVAMGTPHRGTRRAEGWPLGLARELTPGSPTLRTLEATRSKLSHARLTSVVGLQDLLVTPESAALAGSRVVHVDGVGHHGLLYHPEAWDVTIEEITHAARKAEHRHHPRERHDSGVRAVHTASGANEEEARRHAHPMKLRARGG